MLHFDNSKNTICYSYSLLYKALCYRQSILSKYL